MLKTTPPIHDTPTGYDFEFDDPLTPAAAIRMQCRHCTCNKFIEISLCTARPDKCRLWPYRHGHGREEGRGYPRETRAKAIRRECLYCMGNSRDLVKTCDTTYCPLWPYRLGRGICTDPAGEIVQTRRPNQVYSEERRAALRENIKKARVIRNNSQKRRPPLSEGFNTTPTPEPPKTGPLAIPEEVVT